MKHDERRCSKCKAVKSITEFYKQKGRKDGFKSWCKSCEKEWRKVYVEKNRGKINKQSNALYHARYRTDAEYRKTRRLRGRAARFDMAVDDYVDMYNGLMEKQQGRCAICGCHHVDLGKAFDVDHDHVTGKIRGLLCNACNTSLGLMGDDPVRLRRAADYIEEY